MKKTEKPQHSPSPKGAPTWRNDGQDEARAQAFIEGKNFASAHAQRLADALTKIVRIGGVTAETAIAREALAEWSKSA